MTRRLVLFDIDGTILLTAGAGRRAITAALGEAVGHSAGFHGIRFDGKTDPQIVAEMLTAAGHDGPHDEDRVMELCRRYVALLEAELVAPETTTTLMPGINVLLDRLERHEHAVLGLLTGNLAQGAALKLRAAGIAPERFAVGAYGSDSARRADLPAIAAARAESRFGHVPTGHEVVIIGDTPADVTCGAAIGARAVGVATGAYGIEELASHGAHAVFADLSDTDRVIEAILG